MTRIVPFAGSGLDLGAHRFIVQSELRLDLPRAS